jgi:hypothetical protein
MTSQDETPSDIARAAGWRSGLRLSGLQSMRAAASLDLDAALDQSGIDQQADADAAGPTPLGARRRLRALTARSWSPQAIAVETGIPASLISSLLGGIRHDLSPDQHLAIANAYDKIWDRDPPASTREQHEACELARSHAAGRGWAPPQAWDDAQIDQPDGRPSPDWKPRKRTTRRAVDIVEDAQFVRDHGATARLTTIRSLCAWGSAATSSTRPTAAPAATPLARPLWARRPRPRRSWAARHPHKRSLEKREP